VAAQTKCPACGRMLRVPDEFADPVLTCPRCLAEVPNPRRRAEDATARQGAPGPTVEPVPPRTSSAAITEAPETARRTCPGCGRLLQGDWQFCPFCDYRQRAGHALRKGLPPADHEARQDTKGVGCGLIGLAVLGALGLGAYFLPSMAYFAQSGRVEMLIPLVLVVLFLGGITTGVMFARTRHNPEARGIGRVIFGTLVAAGILCLITLAAGIVFFVVCLASFRGR
jgi:DNA-directed RNA polymerase subunit M/transcription elongation factor TFIIS